MSQPAIYRNEDWVCWVRRSSGWHKWLHISRSVVFNNMGDIAVQHYSFR